MEDYIREQAYNTGKQELNKVVEKLEHQLHEKALQM